MNAVVDGDDEREVLHFAAYWYRLTNHLSHAFFSLALNAYAMIPGRKGIFEWNVRSDMSTHAFL